MLILILFLSSVLITLLAKWIIKPELIESLIYNFPSYDWTHFAIFLLLFNYSILAFSLYTLPKIKSNSDLNLPIGGLIAASTIGSLLSFSFNFNFLWSAITPKYLTLIILAIYAINFFIPLSIFSIKKSEQSAETDDYKYKKSLSKLRKILAQVEFSMIQSKNNLVELNVLSKKVNSVNINNEDLISSIDYLIKITKDLPDHSEISIDLETLRHDINAA